LYRRERKDMPAAEEEILAAVHEGIKIEYLVAPLKIQGKDGKVSAIACQRMMLGEFDRSGRKRPIPVEGSEFTLSVDAIVAAIGQVPDTSFVPEDSGVSVNRWACLDLVPDSKSQTTNPKFHAGGDAVTGPDTVIAAIAAGHQAARDIDASIRQSAGEPAWEAPEEEKIDIPLVIDEETLESPQTAMPEMAPSERRQGFAEVELGFTREAAIAEACRCLRCDIEI
ncbi:MAG TPA: FAD-dependent oxidoreductase, partial [Syntrophales bacterium]|nr:FAD-dependent oxidoreductase [Syntrophales bacterium]